MKLPELMIALGLAIAGCCSKNDPLSEGKNEPVEMIKVNDLLYTDNKGRYYYDFMVEKDKFKLRELTFDSSLVDSCYLDISTFDYYGTFCTDKNNIYFIEGMSGETSVRAESKQEYENVTIYENSRIRVINDTIWYYGFGCIEDTVHYESDNPLSGKKIDPTKLKVLKTSKDYTGGYYHYFIYNDELYRHCCRVKNEKAESVWLNYYYSHREYAKPIVIK